MLFIEGILNHPATTLAIILIAFLFMLKFLDTTYENFVKTTNSIGIPFLAILVLVLGFWMLIVCKEKGIDTTVAGSVLGVGATMLQSQVKGLQHKDDVVLNTPTGDSNPPKQ